MTNELFGQLLAVLTALLWTCSAVAWTSAGRYLGALAISFVRLLLTVPLFLLHGWLFRGLPLPTDATMQQWMFLGLSGFAGFFLSDLCLFKAFLIIGPRLSLMTYSLVPPMCTVFTLFVLGTPLGPLHWLAMVITLSGVVWVVMEQPEHAIEFEDAAAANSARRFHLSGVVLALLGAFWQAVAVMLTKTGLGDYDFSAGTFIRVIGGIAGFVPLIFVLRRWPAMLAAMQCRRAMVILTCGAIVGPYLGVMAYVAALSYCQNPGVVTTITATMPVLIMPFSVLLYHERITARAILGALVSLIGVGLLMW